MARSKARRMKKKKYEWMQTRLNYQVEASAEGSPHADSFYIDVAQGLSLMNRKLIRQGQLFRIKNMKVFQSGDTDNRRVMVSTVPTNWVARNAWVKGKALWDKMNAIATEDLAGTTLYPKYHDYKVYFNVNHRTDVLAGSIPVPCDNDGNAVSTSSAEWVYSEYADSGASSDNYDVKFLGANDTVGGSTDNYLTVGLIDAYRMSRTQPPTGDPVLPSDFKEGPWAQLFGDDEQTNDVLTNLDQDNDSPPYPYNVYIGDGSDDGGFSVGTSGIQKLGNSVGTTLPTFVAPCGLIRVEIDDDSNMEDEPVTITFDVEILGPMDM